MSETYEEGKYEEDDVIQSADYTGYLSVSEYVSGENGMEPDADSNTDDSSDSAN